MEGSGRVLILRYSPGWCMEELNKMAESVSGLSVPTLRYEPGTSRIRRSGHHSNTTFSHVYGHTQSVRSYFIEFSVSYRRLLSILLIWLSTFGNRKSLLKELTFTSQVQRYTALGDNLKLHEICDRWLALLLRIPKVSVSNLGTEAVCLD